MKYGQKSFCKRTIGLETSATGLLSHSYASYPPSNTIQQTQKVYYKGSVPNRRIVEVKWCNFCQCANHGEEICYRTFPELAKLCAVQVSQSQPLTDPLSNPPSSQASKTSAKCQRPNPNSSTPDNNPDPVSFLAVPPIFDSCYMASANNANLLSDAWIWDSANSRHICHDRMFFTTLGPFQNQSPIQRLAGTMISQSIGQVDFRCSNGDGGSEILCSKDVLYIPEADVNLSSQGQIHRERLHPLSIIDNGICIGNKGMFARLVENNLYILDIAGPSGFAFPSINKETLGTWHLRLGHLGRQNIIKLAKGMANGIDLTKHLPHYAGEPCSIGNLQAVAHRDRIEPGLEPLDLVQIDVIGGPRPFY